jgi:hypothetical protein
MNLPTGTQLRRAEKSALRRARLAEMLSSPEILLVALRLYIWHLDRPGEWQDVEELIKACSKLNSCWRTHLTAARRVLGIFKRLYPALQLRLAKDYQWRMKRYAGIDLFDPATEAEFLSLPYDLTINADVEAFAAANPFLLGLTRNFLTRSTLGFPQMQQARPETTNHFDHTSTTGQPATGNFWKAAADQSRRAKAEALARLEQERSGW